ncbi:MAG: glycosyltransferase [Elusimicrobiaceae bacterium]|nr:glycosyltransferase [Elusimicrobiaceae bacterium]
MKILYVITSSDVGGAERALTNLVRFLPKYYQIKVVCLKPLGEQGKILRELGADITSLNMQGAGLGIVSKLVHEIESFKPDIVHAMLFRAIEFTRLACAGRNINLITTPHFDLSKKPLWMRWLDRSLKSIDTISTAESVSTYNYLVDIQGYPNKKTLLIGNSVEKSLFFKDNYLKSHMREKYHFAKDDVIFISVARLAAVKNPLFAAKVFLKILSTCPKAKFVFVGEGMERTVLEKFIQENKLEKQIILAGEQKNINEWLNLADVFVLVSKEESLPLALLEARQIGLPCIVSNVGDMPKLVEHGKNGFVGRPKDEILMSCFFAELYENKQLRQQMGEKSLCMAGQVKDSSQQYQQLYQQILNQ